ncbi:DUF5615 family PIN-like protein [Candidatus Woesearchaeota archaeon]|nr:DUF5615 family PIN-like protein [Candidatus Woesearchaeota archaeon]
MTEIRIYSDEDVNIAVTEGLKRRGMKSYSCQEFGNIGLGDEDQIKFANSRKLVILTHDADFLRIIAEKKLNHSGIIFVQQSKLNVGELIRKIEFLVSIASEEDMKNHIEFL